MAKYTSVLHQLLRHVPRDEFRAIVERHQGDKGVRKLSCWGQFVALFFGQLTGQHSLRDLITTLDAGRKKLQQVGLGAVSRSTLADANRKRPQEIFGELFGCLYQRCRRQAPGQRFAFRHRVWPAFDWRHLPIYRMNRKSSGSCLAACTSAVGVRLPGSVSPSGIGSTVWMRR